MIDGMRAVEYTMLRDRGGTLLDRWTAVGKTSNAIGLGTYFSIIIHDGMTVIILVRCYVL